MPMSEKTQDVPVSKLRESPANPRQLFGSIPELAETIQQQGLLQPIIARPVGDDFEVVMGHRRLRAVKHLGWKKVAVIVREMDDATALAQMIIENAQREDVTAIELAEGYRRLIDEHRLTVEQVCERVGVKRSTLLAKLQLLKLPEPIRKAVMQGFPWDGARQFAGIEGGERLQLAAFNESLKLVRAGDKWPTSRAITKLVQSRKLTSKKGQTKHQREAKEHGADIALRRRTLERLRAYVAELVERRAQLSDDDLRLLAMADVHTGPDVVREVFQRRGLHPDRMGKVSGAQLRSLPVELAAAKLATLEDGEYSAGAKAVARYIGESLSEMEKTTRQVAEAEGLFRKPQ